MTALPLSVATFTPESLPAVEPDALLGLYRQPPMELVRGAGVRVFDADDRAYLDFTSGIGVNALGHGDAGIAQAMHEAAATGLLHTSNLYHTRPGARLASELARLSSLDRVFFCNSGAEANEGAFKFARRWAREVGGTAKHEILAVRGAFHGRLFATLAATDRPKYRAPFRPLAGGVSVVERDLKTLEHVLDGEAVAALVIEVVQGEGGVRVVDAGYLREVRELTRARRVALICDEIQCGLGRTGWMFAYHRGGIVPDLVTLAKPLAGGLPMGAVLMTSEIAAAIRPGDHGTTFGGGPFVASVALHVLDRLGDPALLQHVAETGTWLGEQLGALAARSGRVRAVRGIGFMWGLDVMQPAAETVRKALDAGLLVCTAGDFTVRLLPPLVSTRDELSEGLAMLEAALG
ncbi:MAG TPA: acetylornithine transaminase [Gemmatimonadaceae bacterium]|nr:acetylornithine transaminase [Gemmatimonadaceae bacterium]